MRYFISIFLIWLASCKSPLPGNVILFDYHKLNPEGLSGPPSGLVSVDYEFCIPNRPEVKNEVRSIDPSIKFMEGSRGRIGCGPATVLCIGNTHQPRARQILETLARLPYIDRIDQCFWE